MFDRGCLLARGPTTAPDLFGYWLTGRLATEQTIASTSQLLDVNTRSWATGVIEKLGIRR